MFNATTTDIMRWRFQGHRRGLLMAACMAGVAAFAGPAVAQSPGIRGEIGYEGGAIIPEGEIEIRLEGADSEDSAEQAMRLRSDGKSTTIDFVLPASGGASPPLEIVARLERADGWLVARGSARAESPGAPVHLTLNRAMY